MELTTGLAKDDVDQLIENGSLRNCPYSKPIILV